MSDMRSFIKVEHSRFTLIFRKGMLPFRLDLAPALGTRANPVKTHQSILSSKYSMSSQIEGMT